MFDFSEAGSSIPSNASINKATLAIYRTHEPQLNLSYGYDQDGQIFCNPSTVDWSTSTEGFRTLFPKIVDAHNSRFTDTLDYIKNTIDWIEFDVTDMVTEMIAEPSSNNGFILRGFIPGSAPTTWGTVGNTSVFDDPGHSGINGGYASTENSDVSLRPKLTITYNNDTPVKSNNSFKNENVSILKHKNKIEITGLSGNYAEISFLSLNGRFLSTKRVDVIHKSISVNIPEIAKNVLILEINSENLNLIEKIIR